MLTLAVESSCDDLSIAVYDGAQKKLRSLVTRSGVASQGRFQGVVPEVAARDHMVSLEPALDEALSQAGVGLQDLDGVCATYGPGLIGSLLIGHGFARALSLSLGKPFAGVNHLQAHAHAFRLEEPDFRESFLALVVSGGHTDLATFEIPSPQRGGGKGEGNKSGNVPYWQARRLATTRDDAAGETFDKVARLLNLGYPGGPAVEKALAGYEGPAEAFSLPRMKDGSGDFSFSGLKTAVSLKVRALKETGGELKPQDALRLAKGFQETAVKALVRAASREAKDYKVLSVGGGVAANKRLRAAVQEALPGIQLKLSPLKYCGDNAAMIALLGAEKLMAGTFEGPGLEPDSGLTIEKA